MPSKLIPCPFCRSRQITIEHYSTGREQIFYANCTNCGADGPAKNSRTDAVSAWNRRPKGGDGGVDA